MGEQSKIEWTDNTFNPWIGCTKVSAGCKNCYAEQQDKFRSWTPDGWGVGKPRKRTSVGTWAKPLQWDREAAAAGKRSRVFCASLADVFDGEVDDSWRADLFDIIKQTPSLDWQLLTKRPENILPFLRRAEHQTSGDEWNYWANWINGVPPENVWLGTSVEDQDAADKRIPELLAVPAAVRFLSCEPLLGEVSFRWAMWVDHAATMEKYGSVGQLDGLRGIHWIIIGGESGPHARPMSPKWARRICAEAGEAGIPVLFKQWGEYVEWTGAESPSPSYRFPHPDNTPMVRIGKKAAGRILDGRTHDEYPQGRVNA